MNERDEAALGAEVANWPRHSAWLRDAFESRRRSYWLCRSYLCLSIIVTVAIGLYSTFSLNRIAFFIWTGNNTFAGWCVLCSLLGLSVVGLLDVVMNDWLREPPGGIHWLRKRRWMVYIALAFLMSFLVFVNIDRNLLHGLLFRYALDCAFATALAGLSITSRVDLR